MKHYTAAHPCIIFVFSFLLLLPCSLPAAAQQAGGSIFGNFIDPNGEIVERLNTPVFLTNSETGEEFTADMSTVGQYSLSNLPAGNYELYFPSGCCMYRPYTEENVSIAPGETLQFDLNLEWGINLGTIGDDPGMLSNDMRARAGDLTGLPTPRRPDGKPDLSGIWYNILDQRNNRAPRMQPWAQEMDDLLDELNAQGPASYCLPQSAIFTTLPFPYKFIQTDELIIQLVEFATPGFRQIFMDGRELPEIWNPAWLGHSTAVWDGDTLVVTTNGFNEITPGFGVHTDQLVVTERFTRTNYGTLMIEISAEDPEAFEEPYTRYYQAGLTPTEEILEFVCAEGFSEALYDQEPWRGRP